MSDFIANRLLAAAFFVVWGLTGCTAVVGDACQVQTDCGQEMFCETSLPEGYCTVQDCEFISCPEEGVCVVFTQDYPPAVGEAIGQEAIGSGVSFCMKRCESDVDCRDGYRCVDGIGPHPFCNDAQGEDSSG